MKECTIFAGGEIRDYGFIDIDYAKYGFVICADIGYRHALKLGITPNLILGDFDSYKGELPENTEIIRTKPEKDDTDTMLAVKIAIERGYDKIFLYGGMGGRFDHTFANVQTLIYAYENSCEMVMLDEKNTIFVFGKGTRCFESDESRYISIFALSEKLYIKKFSGVRYPLKDYVLKPSFPLGVSNEFKAEFADLEIESGLALIVLSEK